MTTYEKWSEMPLNSIEPRGWLLRYLQLQKDGLTGHLEVAGYPFDSVSWAVGDEASASGTENPSWWAYEQTAYWLDGMVRAGILLNDQELLSRADTIIQAVMDHADVDGYLGPTFLKTTDGWCRWPHVVFFRAVMARHSATGDPRYVEAICRHYLNSPCDYSRCRDVLNVEIMLWAYKHSGDERLLMLAEETYQRYNQHTYDDNTQDAHLSRRKPYAHGVTYNEFAKLGAILYAYTGKRDYLKSSVRAYQKIDRYFMLADGLHCSNEFLLDNDYMRSHETCDVSDYTWSLGYLLESTGAGEYADKIERCVFNAGIGSVDERFRALQYFSCVNQLVLDRHSNHNDFFKGDKWMSYRPNPGTECCAGNVNRFFPNYCARMWMQSKRGIAAVLYGESTVSYAFNGQTCRIEQHTNYPFDDTIRFVFTIDSPVKFAFSMRIPSWCTAPRLVYNGKAVGCEIRNGFVTLDTTFSNRDTVELVLPSDVHVCDDHGKGLYVKKGPLVYTLGMFGERTVDQEDKKSNEAFPAYTIYPDKEWNFGIRAGETRAEFEQICPMSSEPWHVDRVPFSIRIPARSINGWKLKRSKTVYAVDNLYHRPWTRQQKSGNFCFTPRHPSASYIRQHLGDEEWITLVPMGCAKVRLTVFPRIPEDASDKDTHYVYIVRCRDGSLYCGYTNDLEKRIHAHNNGRGAKYTKTRRPVELVYSEEYPTKSEALKRECAVKRLTREQKLVLIQT